MDGGQTYRTYESLRCKPALLCSGTDIFTAYFLPAGTFSGLSLSLYLFFFSSSEVPAALVYNADD